VQNVRLCSATHSNAKSLQFLIPQNRFGAPSAVQSVNSALGYLASHGLTLLGITGVSPGIEFVTTNVGVCRQQVNQNH
jgi:hypothetical protein